MSIMSVWGFLFPGEDGLGFFGGSVAYSCADESDRIREIVVDIDNLCVVPTTPATLLGAAGESETRVLTVEVGGYSLF